jgi:hypothetical protein
MRKEHCGVVGDFSFEKMKGTTTLEPLFSHNYYFLSSEISIDDLV